MGLTLDPATVVADRDPWIVAVNRNQDLLGKTMLVLRRPCTEVVGVDEVEWSVLRSELAQLVRALRALFAPDHFNFAFLMNHDSQVHLHVIPRYAARREWRGLTFEDAHWGRAFGQEQRVLASDELALLAGEIRAALGHTP